MLKAIGVQDSRAAALVKAREVADTLKTMKLRKVTEWLAFSSLMNVNPTWRKIAPP